MSFMKIVLKLFALILLFIFLGAGMCTRVVSYGVDNNTESLTHAYSASVEETLTNAIKALEQLGYQVVTVNYEQNEVVTGWRPTLSDSHYLSLFKRKDFAASDGSYYQVHVKVQPDPAKLQVSVWTTVKSLSGKLASAHVVENTVLQQLDTYMRRPQILMTNVGVEER